MRQLFNLVAGFLLTGILVVAGCARGEDAPTATTAPSSPDPEALALVATARDADVRVGQVISGAVLRQVDYAPGEYTFRFVNPEGTQGVTIFASSGTPREQWRLTEESSPLLGAHPSPELNLNALATGPGSAEHLAREHWQRGDLRSLSLTGKGQDLHWYVFWNLAEGVASGMVNARTGSFMPSPAPPAIPPPTAIVR